MLLLARLPSRPITALEAFGLVRTILVCLSLEVDKSVCLFQADVMDVLDPGASFQGYYKKGKIIKNKSKILHPFTMDGYGVENVLHTYIGR